ncbi:acyl-CoA synthetase [Amycolatopsis sp. SID8362]|uniref:acyl-CoA synthetase n=1 Tax=Amycolatopsis sp. SID8362 TaxID=2690346 RepID=UPI00136BAA7B|nr:acyl-CoA synthetase [Amycolatopsis sp. SID8362]NBH03574.1 acyl-CoA synthetase [Amycolatopsis sp. SID8362]NED40275.1 acyl-CoA synthetase [Amycolatopsis sp. SID8362]
MTGASLWPRYAEPTDLAAIEAVPLAERGLPESTYALLQRAAAWWPDHPATTVLPEAARWREPVRRTFAELLADVHRYANLLRQLGIRRGDAVALLSPNCADLIPATLAAQLAGIAAPLNGGLSRDHLGELLRRSGARVLITAGPELAPEVWDTARTLAAELDVVLVLRPTGASAALPAIEGVRVGDLAELSATMDTSGFAGELPVASDLAALFHTGGTTGAPKLAAHTHANEVADAWMIAANSLLDVGSVVFAALPLFHVNALVVTLLAPLFKGQHAVWAGPLGYREPALYGEFWKIVEHHRIAAMSAVPTVYAVLAQCPVDADIASLRFAMVGASPLPAAVREGFQAHTGVTLVEGYGLTEATCASARSFPDVPRPGTVGQRLPYQRMKVVHPETGEELPGGETGVLAISGPTVFPGYVVGRDSNAYILDGLGKLRDGWLNTGDLARLDADGFVHLAGRAKDLIIRGGHNIDPALIEDALLAHPQVTAAGAVGRPDEHSGEVPVAYVTLVHGATVTEDELLAWAAERVPERAAAPKVVTVLDALPVTDVGKPYKLALRADATRRAIAEALAPFEGVVEALIEDGTVVAAVTLPSDVDESKVAATLARYTVPTRLTCGETS